MQISVDKVLPNPDQPRTIFDETELASLADTIKEKGQIHPIIVEKAPDGYYILIDGERRLRAVKLLGHKTIRAEVRENATDDRLELALISNLQRSSMGPVDEGRAYKKLVAKYKTIVAVSKLMGISVPSISLRLSMLELPEEVQRLYNLKALQISLDVLKALKKLDSRNMIRVSAIAAARGLTAKATILLIGQELRRVSSPKNTKNGKGGEKKRLKPGPKPGQRVGPRLTKYIPREESLVRAPMVMNTYQIHGDHFNALAMVGDRHKLPNIVIDITNNTCQDCPLYRESSPTTCGQCPMVDFLNRLSVEMKKL